MPVYDAANIPDTVGRGTLDPELEAWLPSGPTLGADVPIAQGRRDHKRGNRHTHCLCIAHPRLTFGREQFATDASYRALPRILLGTAGRVRLPGQVGNRDLQGSGEGQQLPHVVQAPTALLDSPNHGHAETRPPGQPLLGPAAPQPRLGQSLAIMVSALAHPATTSRCSVSPLSGHCKH
jgi:hypothetical protein